MGTLHKQTRKKMAPDPKATNLRFQRIIAKRGANGIIGLNRCFKIIDKDGGGTLDKTEFARALKMFKVELSDAEMEALFVFYDKDDGGTVSQNEFLSGLRGGLNGPRKEVVDKSFDKIDIDNSGEIDFNDLKDKYDTSHHPKVMKGEWTHEDACNDFLNTFEGEDGNKDGTVTREEFYDYYGGLSASIDDDDFFGVMMDKSWDIGFMPEREFQTILKLVRERAAQRTGTNNPKAAIKKVFAYFDSDKSKQVSLDEFSSAIESLVPGLSQKDKGLMFARFDDDDSGEISYDEFISAVFPGK